MYIYNVHGKNVTAQVFTVDAQQVFLDTRGNDGENITIPELGALLQHVKKKHSNIQSAAQSTLHPVLRSNLLSQPMGGQRSIDFSDLLTSLKNADGTVVMHMPTPQITEVQSLDKESVLNELQALGYLNLEKYGDFYDSRAYQALKQAWEAYVTSYTQTERAQRQLTETAIQLQEEWFLPEYLQSNNQQSG